MSLETWKAEFYPVDVRKATGSDIDATEHSLRKWRGLTPSNLKKHGMAQDADAIFETNNITARFDITSETCALCERSYQCDLEEACETCPLFKARLGVACFERRPNEKRSPYDRFVLESSARPMVKALEMTILKLRTKKI